MRYVLALLLGSHNATRQSGCSTVVSSLCEARGYCEQVTTAARPWCDRSTVNAAAKQTKQIYAKQSRGLAKKTNTVFIAIRVGVPPVPPLPYGWDISGKYVFHDY